jgi:hypothetical protein
MKLVTGVLSSYLQTPRFMLVKKKPDSQELGMPIKMTSKC